MPAIRKANVKIKRAYEPSKTSDGIRVLVDRLWPRGLNKRKAAIDIWMKDIAPSTDLRKWFGHDPGRWPEFRTRYRAEINRRPGQLRQLRAIARKGPVTLVYSARDESHNDAIVLRSVIVRK
jgi:uncharacterized protein YeaO (DUF488 family)